MHGKCIDPYYEWLGIPPKEHPPNHYRLLGLELFEENRGVIDTAANRQMSFIKQYQAGADSDLTEKLLNELATARICLLSPAAKKAYDQRLRAKLEAQTPSATATGFASEDHLPHGNSVPCPSIAPGLSSPITRADAAALTKCDYHQGAEPPVSVPFADHSAQMAAIRNSEAPSPVIVHTRSIVLARQRTSFKVLAIAVCMLASASVILLALLLVEPSWLRPESHGLTSGINPAGFSQTTGSPPDAVPVPDQTSPGEVCSSSGSAVSLVVESGESEASPLGELIVTPATEGSVEFPTTPVEFRPSPEETLEQSEERLRTAAQRASSSAEYHAVAEESLTLAYRAIVDSQTELAKQVAQCAPVAARKSGSEDLVRRVTLLWSDLARSLTDDVEEQAYQRLLERNITPLAGWQGTGQKQ